MAAAGHHSRHGQLDPMQCPPSKTISPLTTTNANQTGLRKLNRPFLSSHDEGLRRLGSPNVVSLFLLMEVDIHLKILGTSSSWEARIGAQFIWRAANGYDNRGNCFEYVSYT